MTVGEVRHGPSLALHVSGPFHVAAGYPYADNPHYVRSSTPFSSDESGLSSPAYIADPDYGWDRFCEQRFGTHLAHGFCRCQSVELPQHRRQALYRHFADRDALISAVAAVGYRELAGDMAGKRPSPSTTEDLVAVGVAYVEFAVRRPALFHLMFGEPCDRENSERVAATAAIAEFVSNAVQRTFPGADVQATTTGIWALVHGLAFLHLDGKLDTSTTADVSQRVAAAVRATLTASGPVPTSSANHQSGRAISSTRPTQASGVRN